MAARSRRHRRAIPFGVSVGNTVSGNIIWQFPPSPAFPTTPVNITTFDSTFKIGTATYQRSVVNGGPSGTEFVFFSGGFLDDLLIEYPTGPVFPAMSLESTIFYTEFTGGGITNPCTEGATCGTLNFGDPFGVPQIVATPAPATAALLGLGLAALALTRRRTTRR